MEQKQILINVKGLSKHFTVTKGFFKRTTHIVKAVDGVDLFIRKGEVLGLVGESGCGKTTVGRCMMRAIEPTSGTVDFRISETEILDVLKLNPEKLKEVRRYMRLIFQDPYSSLNPRMNVFDVIAEPLIINNLVKDKTELKGRVEAIIKKVGLDPKHMYRYPHAFSGGQRQRVAIARALISDPKFVVADEPVSALDVSVQAQILNLLQDLQSEFHLTYLFISHNLAVVEHISDRVAVMYVGKVVELAGTSELFGNPKHPYTEALLSSACRTDPRYEKKRIILEGDVADPSNPPKGCYFHPRCKYAQDICRNEHPPLIDTNKDEANPHFSACHFADKLPLQGIK